MAFLNPLCTVSDVARSTRFYQETFGFPVISEFGERGCAMHAGTRQVLLLFKKGASRAIHVVESEKSIVLFWAVLKWSVQSNRYGDVSISGCRSIPRHQSRLECSEFRCNRPWDTMYLGQRSE
jgi:hypothetical protein